MGPIRMKGDTTMKIKEFMTVLWEVNPPPYGDITLDLIINKYNVISESQDGHRLLWLEDNDGRHYIIADYENADKKFVFTVV